MTVDRHKAKIIGDPAGMFYTVMRIRDAKLLCCTASLNAAAGRLKKGTCYGKGLSPELSLQECMTQRLRFVKPAA